MKKVLSWKRLQFHTLMTIVMLKAAATAPLFLTLHVHYVMVFRCVPSFSPSIPFHPIPLPFGVGVVVVGVCVLTSPSILFPLCPFSSVSPPPPPHPLRSSPHYFHPPPTPQCSFYSPISLHYPPPPPHFTVILALRHDSSPLFIRTCDSKLPYTVTPVLCNHPWDATKTSVSHMASVFTDSTRRGEIWPSCCNVTVTVIKLDVTKIMQSCLSCFTSNMSQQSWQSVTSTPPPPTHPLLFCLLVSACFYETAFIVLTAFICLLFIHVFECHCDNNLFHVICHCDKILYIYKQVAHIALLWILVPSV